MDIKILFFELSKSKVINQWGIKWYHIKCLT